MLIATGRLERGALAGHVVLVTGAGGGIGFEAARSLLWLGARVVVAEIDMEAGREAEARLAAEWAPDRVAFLPTDVGDEAGVAHLREATSRLFGGIDAVVNNATFAPVGKPVVESQVEDWDRSYATNLRGPVLLARAMLPAMIARGRGVFACVSSTGGPFLAPYETLKAAQVALAAALDAELEGTGVIAFTIGPGLVPTQTASEAIELIAPRLGMTVEQFWTANRGAVLTVEAAGAGLAAAIAQAERYAGQEISSSQALIDAGIAISTEDEEPRASERATDGVAAAALSGPVRATLARQVEDWNARSFFERQWMQRDFKRRVGVPPEKCLETLAALDRRLAGAGCIVARDERELLERLSAFYVHLDEMARGYVKDPRQRDDQLRMVEGWRAEVDTLLAALNPKALDLQLAGR